MESVAAAWARLHFQFFDTTVKQKHDSCTPSIGRVEWITESLKKCHACDCMPASAKISKIFWDLLFFLRKNGLCHWIACLSAYIGHCKQLLLHGWCLSCTTG